MIRTNGSLFAAVVDLASGQVVGGFSGAVRLPLVRFQNACAATTRIPLVVGTASFLPTLGYAIPRGRWGITADLELEDRRVIRTPTMPFEIVPS